MECCETLCLLREGEIIIIDAVQCIAETNYIAYVVRYSNVQVTRRYSDFSSLRSSLVSLHPAVCVPPIPEKHSIFDYAKRPIGAKMDVQMRRRRLQSFLDKVVSHPVLFGEHLFHRFLDPSTKWKGIATGVNLGRPKQDLITRNVPPEFSEADSAIKQLEAHAKDIEKAINQVIHKNNELVSDYCELAAQYNLLSMIEGPGVRSLVGKVSIVLETQHDHAKSHNLGLQTQVAEPLHEYVQLCAITRSVLQYRDSRQQETQTLRDLLESKRIQHLQLTKAGEEASKINQALMLSNSFEAKKTAEIVEIISELEIKLKNANEQLNIVNSSVRMEIARFNDYRIQGLVQIMRSIATVNSTHCKRVLKHWEDLSNMFSACNVLEQ